MNETKINSRYSITEAEKNYLKKYCRFSLDSGKYGESVISYVFDEYEDFKNYLKNYPKSLETNTKSRRREAESFTNYQTYQQTAQMQETGDSETAQQLKARYIELKHELKPQTVEKEEFYFSDENTLGLIDVGTYMTGEPECFLSSTIEEQGQKKKVAKIIVNVGCSGGRSSDEYLERGAVIMNVIEHLENNGVDSELWVCDGTTGSKKTEAMVMIKLKSAGQLLDIDKLAFVLGNVAFYRCLFFHFIETYILSMRVALGGGVGGGYGTPYELDELAIDVFKIYDAEKDVYMPFNFDRVLGSNKEKWIKEVLAKFINEK